MNIILTGASKGIGYETAKLLSAGHKVIAIARNAGRLKKLQKESDSKNIIPIPFDLEKGDIQKALIPQILSSLSLKKGSESKAGVDVLIHNAAVLVKKPFGQILQKDFEKVFRINFFAVAELTQALLPYFALLPPSQGKGRRGHVLNIASMGGVQGSVKFPGLSAYSASKGALITLTECLAEEYKEKNISFNSLAFGAVQTEMLSGAFPGFKAPLTAEQAAKFVADFAVTGQNYFNGKILQMALSTP